MSSLCSRSRDSAFTLLIRDALLLTAANCVLPGNIGGVIVQTEYPVFCGGGIALCALSSLGHLHRLDINLVHRRNAFLNDRGQVGCETDIPVRGWRGQTCAAASPHLNAFRYGRFSGLIFTLSMGETRSLITARCWAARWTYCDVIASVVWPSLCCNEIASPPLTRY